MPHLFSSPVARPTCAKGQSHLQSLHLIINSDYARSHPATTPATPTVTPACTIPFSHKQHDAHASLTTCMGRDRKPDQVMQKKEAAGLVSSVALLTWKAPQGTSSIDQANEFEQ
eukprot:1161900-Pelagomonas_calceolata.AAC.10